MPTQQGLFTQPVKINLTASMPDITDDKLIALYSYRLRRGNAIWFAARSDGYYIGGKPAHTISIEKGASVKCARSYYSQCVELFKQASVRAAVLGVGGTASISSVKNADLPHVTNCLCPACLLIELKRIVAARADHVEISFESDVEE